MFRCGRYIKAVLKNAKKKKKKWNLTLVISRHGVYRSMHVNIEKRKENMIECLCYHIFPLLYLKCFCFVIKKKTKTLTHLFHKHYVFLWVWSRQPVSLQSLALYESGPVQAVGSTQTSQH